MSVRVGDHVFLSFDTSFPLQMLILFSLALTVDHSRVKLKDTENDYINASLIVMEEAQRSYILTQASAVSK